MNISYLKCYATVYGMYCRVGGRGPCERAMFNQLCSKSLQYKRWSPNHLYVNGHEMCCRVGGRGPCARAFFQTTLQHLLIYPGIICWDGALCKGPCQS